MEAYKSSTFCWEIEAFGFMLTKYQIMLTGLQKDYITDTAASAWNWHLQKIRDANLLICFLSNKANHISYLLSCLQRQLSISKSPIELLIPLSEEAYTCRTIPTDWMMLKIWFSHWISVESKLQHMEFVKNGVCLFIYIVVMNSDHRFRGQALM